jgi:hypothetical protein
MCYEGTTTWCKIPRFFVADGVEFAEVNILHNVGNLEDYERNALRSVNSVLSAHNAFVALCNADGELEMCTIHADIFVH